MRDIFFFGLSAMAPSHLLALPIAIDGSSGAGAAGGATGLGRGSSEAGSA